MEIECRVGLGAHLERLWESDARSLSEDQWPKSGRTTLLMFCGPFVPHFPRETSTLRRRPATGESASPLSLTR